MLRHQNEKTYDGMTKDGVQAHHSRKSLFSTPDSSGKENYSKKMQRSTSIDEYVEESALNPFCKSVKSVNPASSARSGVCGLGRQEFTPPPRFRFSSPQNKMCALPQYKNLTPPMYRNHTPPPTFRDFEPATCKVITPPPNTRSKTPYTEASSLMFDHTPESYDGRIRRRQGHESPLSPTALCNELRRTCSLRGLQVDESVSPISVVPTPAKAREFSARCTCVPPPLSGKKVRRTNYGETGQNSRFKEEFQELGILGNGNFGTVLKCRNRLDGCMYAVKVTNQKFRGKADRERVLKEVYALAALCNGDDNPHVVRYFGAFVEDGRLYIQTELCDYSLQDFIIKGLTPEKLNSVAKEMTRQILTGLARLHQENLVHLDIKPANIFIKNGIYKLGDLGHACLARMQTNEPPEDVLPAPPPLTWDTNCSGGPEDSGYDATWDDGVISNPYYIQDIEEGDSRYMPREILNHEYSDLTKSDIFSLGASVYELCLGRELPASGKEWSDIRDGIFDLQALSRMCRPMQILVKLMLLEDPLKRPSATSLLTSGGPGGILRTEWEMRLAKEKAAAEDARKELNHYRMQMARTHSQATGVLHVPNLGLTNRLRRTNTL